MTTPSTLPKVARRIYAARKRAGLTQDQLAAAVGTSRRHVLRWEKGKVSPTRRFQERLAQVLGEPPEYFANGADADSDDDEEDPLPSLDEFLRAHIERMVAEASARMVTA